MLLPIPLHLGPLRDFLQEVFSGCPFLAYQSQSMTAQQSGIGWGSSLARCLALAKCEE